MNLYIRYFDEECLVHSVEEAFDFLSSLQDITVDQDLKDDLRQYVESSMPYPKRYKVRPRVYFIVIKTEASTLADFKARKMHDGGSSPVAIHKASLQEQLMDDHPGWYEGSLTFKRVVLIPGTGKFQYRDTTFRARLKAYSGIDCYNRIINHLRNRQDVDERSQFPSARGKNFKYIFLGMDYKDESTTIPHPYTEDEEDM
jgi:hypothetical protein